MTFRAFACLLFDLGVGERQDGAEAALPRTRPLLATSFLASLLLAAQPPAADERARFAACLDAFLAVQQAGRPAAEPFANALASACALEELAFRRAYVARAVEAGTAYLAADGEAYRTVLDLRNAARNAYLTALQACPP